MNLNYCICVSGNLGLICLKDILDKKIKPVLILTDKESDSIIKIAKNNNIPIFIGNPRNESAIDFIKKLGIIDINVILSVNYLFILDEEFIKLADRYSINFHGSLLPKYRGRTPHVWAIINGEDWCGITAHLMNAKCDDGDIIEQIEIKIEKEDTGASILKKYEDEYPQLIQNIIEKIKKNKIVSTPQNKEYATYFGKRTPDNGHINWNWQKERINNWVRALTNPYPGAFGYIKGKKIIINKISYSNIGYDYRDKNGAVLKTVNGNPVVKTPNGAVELENFIYKDTIKEGDLIE